MNVTAILRKGNSAQMARIEINTFGKDSFEGGRSRGGAGQIEQPQMENR